MFAEAIKHIENFFAGIEAKIEEKIGGVISRVANCDARIAALEKQIAEKLIAAGTPPPQAANIVGICPVCSGNGLVDNKAQTTCPNCAGKGSIAAQ